MAQRDHAADIKVFTGRQKDTLLASLNHAVQNAKVIDLCVSFLMESGARQVVKELKAAAERNVPIRILCGSYLSITQPSALYLLKGELKDKAKLYFYNVPNKSFHPKGYLFTFDDHKEVFIGSSNLSYSALTTGIEWNYRLTDSQDEESCRKFFDEFEELIEKHSDLLTDEKLKSYSDNWKRPLIYKDLERNQIIDLEIQTNAEDQQPEEQRPVPRGPQIEALQALEQTRKEGAKKALVQAATGIGKTYLAAFDSLKFSKVMFVAHRQEILDQAAESFRKVRPESSIGYFVADRKEKDADLIFASVQTLSKKENLRMFKPDEIDYLIIDEAHHMAANSWRKIVDYFKPKFFLGLTATPERGDGKDIFQLCDYNLVYELPLFRAINQGSLSPFHYYGIYDSTDYSQLTFVRGKYNPDELAQLYKTNEERSRIILRNYQKYPSARALGFCASIDHALYMEDYFQNHGVPCACIHSGSDTDRTQTLKDLEEGKVNIVFCVDILNEGVDVPAIDMVLFLRPTQSQTIFLQQLGRGLRKFPGKEYLNVLDFIGNYKNAGLVRGVFSPQRTSNSQGCYTQPIPSDIPEGCLIDFDLELLNLFEEMDKNQKISKKYLNDQIDQIIERIGHIPTRMELASEMEDSLYRWCRKQSFSPFKNYRSYLSSRGLLVDPLDEKAEQFLHNVETTSMTKVYKMPVLKSFIDEDKILPAVSLERLLETWKEFFAENRNWRDLNKCYSYEQYLNISDKVHTNTILNNPVNFLTQQPNGFLIQEKENPIAIPGEVREYLDDPEFVREFNDIIEYRISDYYRIRLEKLEKSH